ncbi:DUF4252 domain-containing protein [Flavobacteriaceae bacterium]|nr:DUF4252 domain-containing protein [Flavobacteriaceae bacterium]MDB9955098.1 DUF4252 domain-containing protein [Flavobacteriaceae bacterium]MDC1265860.1 DUF4252 domain-containing protein [Flavobacteriaceae bacterium]
MKTLLKFSTIFGLLLVLGCSPELTLQTYFVEHQEASGFMSVDIPMSFLNPDKIELTNDQEEAIDSIDKLNMLAYSLKDGTEEEFNTEIAKIKTILKAEKYNELIRGGNSSDGKLYIKYIGEDSEIDELIVFGFSSDNGFAIIRVLGDNMELSKIMKLETVVDQFDTENANVEDFMKFLL